MSRSTKLFQHAPRGMSQFDVAVYLRRSEGWLHEHLPMLLAEGFPAPDPLLGTWDKAAIDRWWNVRSGLAAPPEEDWDAELEKRLAAMYPGDQPARRAS